MNSRTPLPASSAALAVSRFAVPGMRCAGCIAKLENGLAAVPGVAAARVNFTAKQLLISSLSDTQSLLADLEGEPAR